jgi:hypothetical protein
MTIFFKIFISLSILLFPFSSTFSQSKLDSIKGSWDIFLIEKSSTMSDETLEQMKRTTSPINNNNIAIYNFRKNGSFKFSSIQDFGASNEEGHYKVNEKKGFIKRTSSYSNPLNPKSGSRKTVKEFICYLEGDYLVLRRKEMYIYLHRYNN